MAITRSVNFISQQRVDSPDLKSIESAVRSDFDSLIQSLVGTSQGYVLRGFELNMAGSIGSAASSLRMIVDPGAIFHTKSSQAGTFFLVPTGTPSQQLNSATNTIVDGAFTPGAINYVGIEYERFIDGTTTAQVYVWNPTTKSETTKSAPRAQILRYRIKISTGSFASTTLPITTILTDSNNNVVSISDVRSNLFRLGTGGISADPYHQYPWPQSKVENNSTSFSSSISPFEGGDKSIGSMKDWMDAIMTSLQDLKGTPFWYSTSTSGSIESLRADLGNTVTTGKGSISHSSVTAGVINWDQPIYIKVVGSNLSYKINTNTSSADITLTDGKVAYLTLVRDIAITPTLDWVNSSDNLASSGGESWTVGLQAGDWVKIGSSNSSGYYQIDSITSASIVKLTTTFSGTTISAKSKYSYGVYYASASPSGDPRAIQIASQGLVPQGQDMFWMLFRSDNGGGIPRVYVRFLGSELEQGETEEISDGTPRQMLQYSGAALETTSLPLYVSAVDPGSVPEINDIKFGDATTIANNDYFFCYSSSNSRHYYVWFNKDTLGVDPAPATEDIPIEVAISTGMTAAQIAVLVASGLAATFSNDFIALQRVTPNTDTVRLTNTSAGASLPPVNFNLSYLVITNVQTGTGRGNYVITDGDNLTLAIKKLDEAVGVHVLNYDEQVTIVASGATPPTSLVGPVLSGTSINIPLNSRNSYAQQLYIVGQGSLLVFLNGQFLRNGTDWAEIGTMGLTSQLIQVNQDLVVGDVLEIRTDAAGGAGGGGGAPGPTGPPGPIGPMGFSAIGGPALISTKTANYTVTTSDNVLLADCTSGPITFALPTAASSTGRIWFFKKIDASGNALSIQGNGIETIDGSNIFLLPVQFQSLSVINDGTSWYVI